jgi:hypothetical protein
MTILVLVAPRSEVSARYRCPIYVCGQPGQSHDPTPQIRKGKEKGDNARVVERLDRVLDALCAERERAVRQPRRARDALELRYALRFFAIYI